MVDFKRCETCPAGLAGGAGEINEQNICHEMTLGNHSINGAKALAQDTYMRFRFLLEETTDYSSLSSIELFDEQMEQMTNSAECLLRNKFGVCNQLLIQEATQIKEQA